MSDNPFDEPDDADRTVVRGPGAGAQPPRPVAPPAFAAPPGFSAGPSPIAAAPVLAAGAENLPRVGPGPLAAAAAPLLEIQARLVSGGGTPPADPAGLLDRTLRAMKQFEADARETGVSNDELREAHYVLCAALDDVVLATPWGATGIWATRSLGSTFHRDVRTGEHAFDRLALMQREPGRFRGALEIFYLTLSLGFQGKYRLAQRGPAELERVREGLYQLLLQIRGAAERELSPRWKGVDAPYRTPGRGVPAWIAAPVVLALLGGMWFWLSGSLGGQADALEARLATLPPGGLPTIDRTAPPVPPAPPPPPPPTAPRAPDAAPTLRRFLAKEIDQKLVTVEADGQRLLVRISNKGMFPSGSATVSDEFTSILNRIGEGLKEEPGAVTVIGHSDNQPIRTVRFPNNTVLSGARAEAALALIAKANGDPGRFKAEGRADSEPLASNATPEGREANRRIEVLLLRGRN